jgi:general secretion pathway protein A
MVSQLLLQSLDRNRFAVVLVLVTPGMSKSVMLKEILKELGLKDLPVRTRDLIDLLHQAVIDLHAAGKQPVVMVDEAHFLSSGALHTLRTVSNLETPVKKLCTVLLFAESTFLRRLRHPSYRSLSSRIYHKVSLDRMSEEETMQYVNFRMMVAGAQQELFERAALSAVHSLSDGVCRDVSRICYLALMEGACRGADRITEEIVRSV